MKKILGTAIGLLLVASSGHAFKSVNCSDAYGNLRMTKTEDDGSKKTQWYFEGTELDDDVKAKLKENLQIVGDEYNGYSAARASLKGDDHFRAKGWVMCQKVDTNKAKILPPEFQAERVAANIPAHVSCSDPNANLRKVVTSDSTYWMLDNEVVPMTASVYSTAAVNRQLEDGNHAMEIFFDYNDGSQSVPRMVLCR